MMYARAPLIAAVVGGAVLCALAIDRAQDWEVAVARSVSGMSPLAAGLLAAVFTAIATGVGALPILLTRKISARAQTAMLGFSAGVMLAASIFSLILPALAAAGAMTGDKVSGVLLTSSAVLLGAGLLLIMDQLIPHEHAVQGVHGLRYDAMRRVWLFVFAITLHNIPEGLAIGVSFAGEGSAGFPLALGIAVQNIPEGLAVALAMLTLSYTRAQAVLIGFATGWVEPLGALLGAGAMAVSSTLLPWGLGFAAGAMLFVISHEIIPESHRNGRETAATIGLFIGFVLMMAFDTMLS
jgi:ZIP family zinc transporter